MNEQILKISYRICSRGFNVLIMIMIKVQVINAIELFMEQLQCLVKA